MSSRHLPRARDNSSGCRDVGVGAEEVLSADLFETPAGTIAEDQLRVERARWVLPIVSPLGWTQLEPKLALAEHYLRYPTRPIPVPVLDRAAVLSLIEKIQANIDAKAPIFPTMASSIAMRAMRVEVIGALLDATAELSDAELCTVTLAKPSWVLTPIELFETDGKLLKRQLAQELKHPIFSRCDDPLVAFLHGEFEPTTGVFVLHWHAVTTKAKAALLKKRWDKISTKSSSSTLLKRPIRRCKVKDRVRQLTYLFKSFWPQRALRQTENGWKRDRVYHRVAEPWSTIYLLWLDRHCLHDLTVINGCWSQRKGGSEAWRQFYLIRASWSRTMRSGA